MSIPIEAYRQGYEKGRNDTAGGRMAEITMGMLRDDPGGHFQKGYSDGAAGKPFNPPPAPTTSRNTKLVPKFSENPGGWFVAVMIIVEVWVLWQLVKAPFQLIAALLRSEKPSLWVILKNAIVAGLTVALVWWVPRTNQIQGSGLRPVSTPQSQTAEVPIYVHSVSVTDDGNGTHTNTLLRGAMKTVLNDEALRVYALISYNNTHDILHVMCPTAFRLDGARSATGNQVGLDTDTMAHIEIFAGKSNNLSVTCAYNAPH